MRTVVAAMVLLAGLTACADPDGEPSTERTGDPPSSDASTPSPAPSSAPSGPSSDGAGVDLAATEVCGLVRDGIDAFNLGDLDGTIATFEDAIEPAEDLAREQPSEDTETLLDAVRYYAELPARDYLEASTSSPEFLEFKDFTLTRCEYGGPPAEATDPGIPA